MKIDSEVRGNTNRKGDSVDVSVTASSACVQCKRNGAAAACRARRNGRPAGASGRPTPRANTKESCFHRKYWSNGVLCFRTRVIGASSEVANFLPSQPLSRGASFQILGGLVRSRGQFKVRPDLPCRTRKSFAKFLFAIRMRMVLYGFRVYRWHAAVRYRLLSTCSLQHRKEIIAMGLGGPLPGTPHQE